MSASRIAVLLFLIAGGPADAASLVWSYTMDEMHERATAYKLLAEQKIPSDPDHAVEMVLKAGEFKGYIAAFLDQEARVNPDSVFGKCVRKLPVVEISRRAAILIASSPLNRSIISWLAVVTAVGVACEESPPKKPKPRTQ